jgi:hypothetical protein
MVLQGAEVDANQELLLSGYVCVAVASVINPRVTIAGADVTRMRPFAEMLAMPQWTRVDGTI